MRGSGSPRLMKPMYAINNRRRREWLEAVDGARVTRWRWDGWMNRCRRGGNEEASPAAGWMDVSSGGGRGECGRDRGLRTVNSELM